MAIKLHPTPSNTIISSFFEFSFYTNINIYMKLLHLQEFMDQPGTTNPTN